MKALILKLLPYIIGLLLLAGFVNRCSKAYKEAQAKKRVEAAMLTSKTPAKTFTAKNGQTASKTDVQELTPMEVKTIYPEVIKQADNVKVKPGQILNYSQQGYRFSQDMAVPLKDTTNRYIGLFNQADSAFNNKYGVINPYIGYSLKFPDKDSVIHFKSFRYSDKWTTIKGTIINDSVKVNIQSVDTITSFTHKGDRVHPWLWILSRRKTQQTITNSNPHTKIVFQEAINTL